MFKIIKIVYLKKLGKLLNFYEIYTLKNPSLYIHKHYDK